MTTHTTNVELELPELDATKIVMWKFHEDDSQENAQYGMIIGWYLLSEIQIDLCFSDFTIRVNRGAYGRCAITMRDMNKSYERISPNHLDGISFKDK